MHATWWTFLGVLAALGPSCLAAGLDVEALVQQNEAAVVVILGRNPVDRAEVQSSGCFVHRSGLILTTTHQVRGLEDLRAVLRDGARRPLSVVALDKEHELALLRADGDPLAVVAIGDATALKSGAPLVAIAAPEGLSFSTVTGVVSSANRSYQGYRVIQTNLPASPGSSGGPVFDKAGAVVGLVVCKLTGQDWASFVNPINNAYDLLRQHGVPVPLAPPPLASADEAEILPADGISPLELEAVRAYNRGVRADTLEGKLAAYGAAVTFLPEFYQAWFNLAVAHTAAGDLDHAAQTYETAQRLRPDAPEVPVNLGRVFLEQGRGNDALACFRRVVQLTPHSAPAYNAVGEAHRQARQYDEAEQAFLNALRLDPAYAAARYNLALTYAAKGRNAEAVAGFREYLRLAPGAPDAREVEQWIRELAQTTE